MPQKKKLTPRVESISHRRGADDIWLTVKGVRYVVQVYNDGICVTCFGSGRDVVQPVLVGVDCNTATLSVRTIGQKKA
jgi:hypothetical protein